MRPPDLQRLDTLASRVLRVTVALQVVKKNWLNLPKIGVYHDSRAPALTPEGELAGRPTTSSLDLPRSGRLSNHVVSLVSPAVESHEQSEGPFAAVPSGRFRNCRLAAIEYS